MNKFYFFLPLVFILILVACTKTDGPGDSEKIKKQDDEILMNYLADKNIDAEKTSSGLYYFLSREGNGVHPNINSSITVLYKGFLANGTVFDQTTGGNSVTFPLKGVIKGWQEGIPYFSEGGTGKLFIPSHLAYGSRGSGTIPPNTPIIFDITLSDVK